MKPAFITRAVLFAGLFIPALAPSVFAKSSKESQAELRAQARVTEEQARAVALAQVPDGTIKEGEVETEHGRFIWSFDLTRPGTDVITEVQVDANTGKLVSVATETPRAEAREARGEGKAHHGRKDNDEDDDADGNKPD
ncbi:MAG TPA: PepSY domain-containing protein [Opitutaceae bacterium]|nr:PepSY domain-containing protein [Opitutaceae bacterium]